MRLVLAKMEHETNTFSPVPTPLARFAQGRSTPLEAAILDLDALALCLIHEQSE